MNSNGALVISLDFELAWGVFDVFDVRTQKDYFQNTRLVIPEILKIFSERDIHASWATVGMLFNRDWNEWQQNIPNKIPAYENSKLSAYGFGNANKDDSLSDLFFAPEIIRGLSKVPGQEIASHTYSHYYCLEKGQDAETFRYDLEKNIELAANLGIRLQSLVFPRNQFRKEYLKICLDLGIKNVRSNPKTWFWKNTISNSLLYKIGRTGDAYVPLSKSTYSIENLHTGEGVPFEQKASRFLRPVENNILRKWKIERIKAEMKYAAVHGEVYHLWWHPHNFGYRSDENLNDLLDLLEYFVQLRQKYSFKSMNMAEVGIKLMNV